jgi:hypothetical protein
MRGEGKFLLGLNEPNYTIDAVTMAHLMYQSFLCHPDRDHIGPGTDDLDWLEDVLETYVNLFGSRPPLVGLDGHCYGVYFLSASIGACKAHVDRLADLAIEYGYDTVFFGEWAYTGASVPEAIQFMEQVGTHMASLPERKPQIQRVYIGWFQLRFEKPVRWWWWDADPQLATWDTQQLTPLGLVYRELATGQR